MRFDHDDEYRIDMCHQYSKFVRLGECNGCFCPVHDSRGNQYLQKMGCTLSSNSELHCMTGNVYFEKYHLHGKNADFENCVELNVR